MRWLGGGGEGGMGTVQERKKKDITFVQSVVVKFGLSITVSDVIDPGSE